MDGLAAVKLELPDHVAATVELAGLIEVGAVGQDTAVGDLSTRVGREPVVPQFWSDDHVVAHEVVESPGHRPEVTRKATEARRPVTQAVGDPGAVVVAEPLKPEATDQVVGEVPEHVLVHTVPVG